MATSSRQPIKFSQANAVQRGIRKFAASGPGSWIFSRMLHRLDRPLYKATKGRYTVAALLGGLPIVMLNTVGAKSGKPRTSPVLGLPTEEGLAVIASNFGQEHNPAWFYNLEKQPLVEIGIDEEVHQVRAVEVEGDRRARVWQEGLKIYPGFSTYEKRASDRQIHVFVLEPR